MNNVEKTAWKIQASCPQGRVLTIDQALVVANVLEEAGLLMPDLPSRDFNTDRNDMNWIRVKNGMIEVVINSGYDSEYEVLTPGEAREYALTILAAAEYAEKEQDNA